MPGILKDESTDLSLWFSVFRHNMNRVIPGLLLALCWLLLLLHGSFLLFLLVIIPVIAIGGHEYIKMAFPEKDITSRAFLKILIVFPALGACYFSSQGVAGGLFLSLLLLTFYIIYSYQRIDDPLLLFSRALFGVMYVGFLGSYFLLLHRLPEGSSWLLVLTAITAGSDSGAYYCGRRFGKHKLCPLVSPNKTIEGAIGGMIAGVAGAVLMAFLLKVQFSLWFLIPAAVLLTGVGIIGDLTESMIKRATGTKDSGTILRGHGGVLDRIDSLLFAVPVLYYLLVWVQHVSVISL
jgi:phosphatidate cytidylyltransferase